MFATKYPGEEEFSVEALIPDVNEGLDVATLFGRAEALAALQRMSDEEELFLSDDKVYKV